VNDASNNIARAWLTPKSSAVRRAKESEEKDEHKKDKCMCIKISAG
jgi:hypothetical protein